MKIEISDTQNRKDFLFVNSISSLNILCSDGEATEIIVDDILSKFEYNYIPTVIQKICSKLKVGGRICIYITDVSLLARDLSQEFISTKEFNEIIFVNDIKSFLDTGYILECLQQCNVKVQTKQIKKHTSIITGIVDE